MKFELPAFPDLADGDLAVTLAGVPDGFKGEITARLAFGAWNAGRKGLVYAASDGQELSVLESALAFHAPGLDAITLPGWDCLPYDRVSPSPDVVARRIDAFGQLAMPRDASRPRIVLTTANALTQRNAPSGTLGAMAMHLAPGNRASMDHLAGWLSANGFERVATVRERGEFAVRGGILDLFAPGRGDPVRLDFFGDTLETIRTFDPATQRTLSQIKSISLSPMSEVVLTPDAISRFRKAYILPIRRGDARGCAVPGGERGQAVRRHGALAAAVP